MRQDEALAAFLDIHIDCAVEEAAVYSTGTAEHGLSAVNALALALFMFTAKTTRSVEAAERAEADFRKRVAVLDAAATDSAH